MGPNALFFAGIAMAQHLSVAMPISTNGAPDWAVTVGVSSASLARDDALLVTTAVVSLKAGEQGLITFWETETSVYRCVDRIGGDYAITLGACYAPR